MHQQYALAAERGDVRVGEQRAAGFTAERLADHEVAVAMHQIEAGSAFAQGAQGGGDLVLVGRHAVIADPHLEKVAENVERLGP